jgi:polygalacturonase
MQSIPSYPAKFDVKANFGARGDGNTDDTKAVQAALAATKQSGGVLYFPPGT